MDSPARTDLDRRRTVAAYWAAICRELGERPEDVKALHIERDGSAIVIYTPEIAAKKLKEADSV